MTCQQNGGGGVTTGCGTIEFQSGSRPVKAQFVRMRSDADPSAVVRVLTVEWRLRPPALLVSLHGGRGSFDLPPRVQVALQAGLAGAAQATAAWVFTGGAGAGVARHVGDAFAAARGRHQLVGIAPWGVVEGRHLLTGNNVSVAYHAAPSTRSDSAALNDRHGYFLLVDDGSEGCYGAESAFRRRLERYIASHKFAKLGGKRCQEESLRPQCCHLRTGGVPLVAVVVEGGANTVRCVLEYVTAAPPVPVVIVDGSGRAADLLAFVHKYADDDGNLSADLWHYVTSTVRRTIGLGSEAEADQLAQELLDCVRHKELVTVFRVGDQIALDHAILAALLRGSGLGFSDQLALAMAWNRADVAASEIFVYGRDCNADQLEHAMMDALANDLVRFVEILVDNGVAMSSFLTQARLEELYNTRLGPANTLKYLVRDVRKHASLRSPISLADVGAVVEKLMGGAYTSLYRSSKRREGSKAAKGHSASFPSPFSDLFLWAVLTRRQQMALFLWRHGEDPMAKALVAMRIYKSMAQEVAQDDLEVDVSDELRRHGREFAALATELLDHGYRRDATTAQRVLTCELQNWSCQTCLTLAVAANHREFLAHPCCQILLADLWMGGLRMRHFVYVKVFLALLFPPLIVVVEFKSQQELEQMPQTEAEHELERRTTDESDDADAVSKDIENGSQLTLPRATSVQSSIGSIETIPVSASTIKRRWKSAKRKPIKLGRKIYEFYTAPVTKFFADMMAYFVFLLVFTYSVLVRMTPVASWAELASVLYAVTLACEKLREVALLEATSLRQKLVLWADNKWNACDAFFVAMLFTAFVVRALPDSLEAARIIYGVDITYFYIRSLHFLGVNKNLGPYVTMMGKMILDMLYFVVLLGVVLMAFGVARQGILFPYAESSWGLLKDVFFQPYFMLYGEVFADTIDPPCGEGPDLTPCRKGRWVTIVLMAIYLLIANILLINLLIAVFNNTFLTVTAISQEVWKSKRYSVVMEYEQKPLLPPPLVVVNHLLLAIGYLLRCFSLDNTKPHRSHVLKLFLSDKEREAIHNFEAECIDGYFNERDKASLRSSEAIVKVTHERVEQMAHHSDDLRHSAKYVLAMQRELECRLAELWESLERVGSALTVIHRFMALHGATPAATSGGGGGDRQSDHSDLSEDSDTSSGSTRPPPPGSGVQRRLSSRRPTDANSAGGSTSERRESLRRFLVTDVSPPGSTATAAPVMPPAATQRKLSLTERIAWERSRKLLLDAERSDYDRLGDVIDRRRRRHSRLRSVPSGSALNATGESATTCHTDAS